MTDAVITSESTAERAVAGSGEQMHAFAARLYPICRSITGSGVRASLELVREKLPALDVHEVPSGTPVYDWTVPREWNIRDAYIKDSRGRTVVNFRRSNLHVMSYSAPVHRTMSLGELGKHLYTLPDHPDWVPYRTSYYKEAWGFCLSHNQLLSLEEGDYEVCIDSDLKPGHLTYGEAYFPGATEEEVLVSCHVCHPSLCNDNLSGIAVATWLAAGIANARSRYSYRFLFIPGTIGSITWLSRNECQASRIRHGLVLTCVGDPAGFHYKRSRRGGAEIDRVVRHVLAHSGHTCEMLDFSPYGYDERQYCSPGFDLPVGCLMRSVHGTFPEYHTSADNLEFITPEALEGTLRVCEDVVGALEGNITYVNQNPKCEPQLGKRGLYRSTGGSGIGDENMAMLWVLNQSDGRHSLLDIAERAALPFSLIRTAADSLAAAGLLREQTSDAGSSLAAAADLERL